MKTQSPRRSPVLIAVLGAFVAGAVALVVAPSPSPLGLGGGPPPESPLPEAGVIRLHFGPGADDYTRFDASDGSGGFIAGTPTPITNIFCLATIGGPLNVSPVPAPPTGRVGVFADAIGVWQSDTTAAPCARVDAPSQQLVIQPAGPAAGTIMDFAELDIGDVRAGSQVRAQLFLGTELVATEVLTSAAGADSPDGNNFRWRLPSNPFEIVHFDRLVLSVNPSAAGGFFSLEGGAEGTTAHPGGLGAALSTTDSLFHVVASDGPLDCGDTETRGGEGVPDVEMTRLENGSGTSEDCEPVQFVLRVDDEDGTQVIEFFKDLDDQAEFDPQFTIHVVWEPEPASYPAAPTLIDFGDGPQPMEICDGTESEPVPPEGQPWCVIRHLVEVAGTDLMQVTEDFFGSGDPKWTR
jgi:hypothetical protein